VSNRWIPVAAPALVGNESAYVKDCIESTWISSSGEFVEKFESEFATYCGVNHGIACANGTMALHLALLAFGVRTGDEVIVPTLAFVAVANAVAYCGAVPVFVDSETRTWNIDPEAIEAKITPRTKGVIAAHLFGHPVDIDPVIAVARRHGLFVVEDGAEAHGAEYKGRRVGSLGDLSTFSFYGNKIITCGEGGMVLTDDPDIDDRVRRLKGQGMDPQRRYWFPMLGYNYRMTNIAAAIGLAQLEKIDWHLMRRAQHAAQYRARLGGHPRIQFQPEMPWARHAHWMVSVVIAGTDERLRDQLISELAGEGIETRPFFYPAHRLPMYQDPQGSGSLPVAEDLAARGLSLPSGGLLSTEEIDYVSSTLINALA
jgi:perosamine synthetase